MYYQFKQVSVIDNTHTIAALFVQNKYRLNCKISRNNEVGRFER